ncbi:MAG: ABC transporter permease [Chloroflexi bacterium]|uniref:ABC transporter permease n=1 Tax=Candidatus Flexifilum breve TaxID=3140694 RepID=UPI00313603BF|nr:ABC transporter permease [Chloroflexota bacterium]
MISDILTAGVFASMIRLATPYLFASIGEMFGQRSGVFNLGVDGIMLMGAFFSFYAVLSTGSLLLGVLVAIIVGAILGLAMAFVSVTLKAEQGISGIGLYLFGLGMSELLFQKWVGTPQSVDGFPRIHFPVLSDIPVIGEIFFNHNLLVYVAFALVPISAYILNKTSFGLSIRAVGQNPQAADAMGVNVRRVRYTTVTIGGILASMAGASLSIALLDVFQQNITGGLGFIAVALVYFGRWRPYGVLVGALLFSFVNALQLQVSAIGIEIPTEFAVMAPYVITIIALVFASRQTEKPDALNKPFERGES